MRYLIVLPILLLASCNTLPKPEQTTAIVCPPLTTWSKDFQNKLADELENIDENSAIMSQMKQHIRLRDQIRVCRG